MLTYARWKYFAILIVLVLSAVYALPNAFPQDPSVQITVNRSAQAGARVDEALRKRVTDALAKAAVTVKSVELKKASNDVLVRLGNADLQTRAADTLRPVLGDDYIVALSLAPTAPAWLSEFGAKPMPLGLDLQGGVHFVLQVDQKAALDKRFEAFVEDTRVTLRDGRVRFSNVARAGSDAIDITVATPADAENARKLLALNFPAFLQQGTGTSLRLTIPAAELNRIARDAIEQNLTTLRNRVNQIGVAEPVVQRQGTDRVVVELPGLQDTAEAKRRIGATATLEFRAVLGDEIAAAAALANNSIPAGARIYYDEAKRPLLLSKRVLVSGDQLVNATPQMDSRTGQPIVSITLNSVGGKRMSDHTLENVGKRMATVYVETIPTTTYVDGKPVRSSKIAERVISAPNIKSPFGREFITEGLSQEEANSLARDLKSGALAAPMDFVEERVVGPSLGAANVERGLTAVKYSFMFALVFFLIYYRVFGLVTCVALLLNLLMVIAVMSLPFIGATMSLPGFAGLALTVGMSVDANVLINERIREELRAGMPPQAAIATGYERASGTIFDSNMTALLAGIALVAFGTGPVKGFALTMIIGILTSLFTAVSVSRGLATLIYGRRQKLKSIWI